MLNKVLTMNDSFQIHDWINSWICAVLFKEGKRWKRCCIEQIQSSPWPTEVSAEKSTLSQELFDSWRLEHEDLV